MIHNRKAATILDYIRAGSAEGWALGQFNMNNMETLRGILDGAYESDAPIIVGVSMGTLRHAGLPWIAGLLRVTKETAKVPVFFHLDHGADVETVSKVLAAGFDSVMLDTSRFTREENVSAVRRAVSLARQYGGAVEAQIGETWDEEGGEQTTRLTEPDEVEAFVRDTGIDYVAVSFGNTPGLVDGTASPDDELLLALIERSPVPVVLHGGTSIPDTVMRRAITAGASKVNIDTFLRNAINESFRRMYCSEESSPDPRVQFKAMREAVGAAVTRKIGLFGTAGRRVDPQ